MELLRNGRISVDATATQEHTMQQVEIIVEGQLDLHWSEWLGGLTVTHTASGQTRLHGRVPDSPALYGLITKLRDLGLKLVLVRSEDIDPGLPHSKLALAPKPA